MSAKKILLDQFEFHHVLFNNVLVNISDEEAHIRVAAPLNNIKWLAGHLLWAQHHLAKLGGANVTLPWRDHFHPKVGASEADLNAAPSEMPTLKMIIDKWNEDAPKIRAGLETITDEALNVITGAKHPMYSFNSTLAGRWAFINHHQAYTIGQIGILRRGLGKDGMKY